MGDQTPDAIVLVRPRHFFPNPQTAGDNAFQTVPVGRTTAEIAASAYDEVTGVAAALADAGVAVHLFESSERALHDGVFPNNWISTHPDGRVALFPMYAESRRPERRADVVELLKRRYRVDCVVDYSGLEHDGVFLEGTGAMVLDHRDRVAYVARSQRADPAAVERFAADFGYEPFVFDAVDASGVPVYHTNVLMSVAESFALVGVELVPEAQTRAALIARLEASGREVIALSAAQVGEFAANAIELQAAGERVLALSRRAAASLDRSQRTAIERSARLLELDVPTIELAGGSVRCMIAGIHLAPRPAPADVAGAGQAGADRSSRRTGSVRKSSAPSPVG